jgi:hypothetical protein
MLLRSLLAGVVAFVLLGGLPLAGGEKKDPKGKDKEKRGGTVVGVLAAKGDNYIEVKADGEEKARKYVPYWRGGAPDKGGGLDKEMLKTFKTLKVGSRVRLEWEFDERPRVVRVEMLKAAGKDGEDKGKKGKEGAGERSGKAVGVLTAKGDNFVEVKADGEERARKYFLLGGGTKDLLDAMRTTPVGSRVQVEWRFVERLRVLSLSVIKKAEGK